MWHGSTMGKGEQSINMQGGDKKRGGSGMQQMHWEIAIQDQIVKAAVAWALVGRVKSGCIDMLID